MLYVLILILAKCARRGSAEVEIAIGIFVEELPKIKREIRPLCVTDLARIVFQPSKRPIDVHQELFRIIQLDFRYQQ